ncbi:unnamed protein product, partial [Rotaria sp. Silwood2]
MLVFITIIFQFSIAQNERTHYGFCNAVGATLCVENNLNEIVTGANIIIDTLVEIEKQIMATEKQSDVFKEHIEEVKKQIAARLPTHHYSNRFINQNNINQ